MRSYSLGIPDYEEQRQIAQTLADADREITALNQQRRAFEEEKKALMQHLLTGQRRVPETYSPPAL